MQAIIEMIVVALAYPLYCFARGIFTVNKPRGNIHVPTGKGGVNCLKPSVNSRFADVDFLSATDQANDNRPIFVAIHAGNQKLRFGLIKTFSLFLSLHEVGSLLQIPSALCLIKNDYVFDRWA